MATSRKLIKAPGLAAAEAEVGLGFGPGSAGDDAVPWDVVEQKLAELLRFLASAVQAVVAALREHAASLFAALGSLVRVALPAAAAVVVLLVVCGCCVVAAQRRRREPNGEEVDGLVGDGPVVTYRGVYKGGIFSMHPNKPIVC
jgi:hypothetical protein